MKLSPAQHKLLSDAARDRHGRVYQANYQANGRSAPHSASAFIRSGQALVRRKMMVDVSSVGVFEITDEGKRYLAAMGTV